MKKHFHTGRRPGLELHLRHLNARVRLVQADLNDPVSVSIEGPRDLLQIISFDEHDDVVILDSGAPIPSTDLPSITINLAMHIFSALIVEPGFVGEIDIADLERVGIIVMSSDCKITANSLKKLSFVITGKSTIKVKSATGVHGYGTDDAQILIEHADFVTDIGGEGRVKASVSYQ